MSKWKVLKNYPEYLICDSGIIYSTYYNRVLNPNIGEWGYARVSLVSNGKRRCAEIHRLVAEHFVPGFCLGLNVNHKNGNKLDNRAENLEWVTPRQNNIHAIASGLKKSCSTSKTMGVFRVSKSKKWKAQIGVNRKCIYLGTFQSKSLAEKAYKLAWGDYYGGCEMKRVFEFYTGKGQQDITTLAESLECVRRSGKPTRITIEGLPESKPEPKNCGNCDLDRNKCTVHERKYGCDAWQPKATEVKAKGWEQRFDTFWKSYADKEDVLYTWNNCQRRKDELLSFIRAEIERVREEEKRAIVAFLRGHWLMTDGLAPMAGDIEQNKHRSEK